jgi:hypothetical protein
MHRADASAHRGPLRSRGYPSRKNPPRGRRRAAWPPTRAQPHFAPRGGLPWPAAPGWVASAQGRPQPVPPAHQATMGRRGQSCSSPLAPPHELISPLTCAYLVRELKGLAVVERCSFARTLRRFTTGSPSSAYRLLSDPLSDYGVDGPYIQLDIHGLSSRSVPDLDDSPTVLRDEEIAGCHPDHKTPGQRRIQIPDWSTRLQVQPPSLPAWSACRMHIKINQKVAQEAAVSS